MPTMKEILSAAAHGSYAELDGVGLVIEQMYKDYLKLHNAQREFLERYGHLVPPRPLEAQPTPQPVSPPPNGHYPPPPYPGQVANGHYQQGAPSAAQTFDERYPLDAEADVAAGVHAIAQRLRPTPRGR